MKSFILLTIIIIFYFPLITHAMPAPTSGVLSKEKPLNKHVTRIDASKIAKIIKTIDRVANEKKYHVLFNDRRLDSVVFIEILSGIFKGEIYRSDYFFPLDAHLKEDFELIKERARHLPTKDLREPLIVYSAVL